MNWSNILMVTHSECSFSAVSMIGMIDCLDLKNKVGISKNFVLDIPAVHDNCPYLVSGSHHTSQVLPKLTTLHLINLNRNKGIFSFMICKCKRLLKEVLVSVDFFIVHCYISGYETLEGFKLAAVGFQVSPSSEIILKTVYKRYNCIR